MVRAGGGWEGGWVGACVAVSALACGATLDGRIETATRKALCPEVLAGAAPLRGDPGYAALTAARRVWYEERLVQCQLQLGKYADAVALARELPDSESLERAYAVAQGEAALEHEPAARATLEGLSREPHVDPEFFAETDELRVYKGQDWFVAAGLRAWERAPAGLFEGFVTRLLRPEAAKLLPLAVAVADPTRSPGEWVAWTGVVRDARLDRGRDRTLLLAEGLDVHNSLVGLDTQVESMKATPLPFGRGAEATAKYRRDRIYQESFTPNGRAFAVRFGSASEKLATLRTFTAVGHFAGRVEDDPRPVVDAVVVVPREARETTQTRRD